MEPSVRAKCLIVIIFSTSFIFKLYCLFAFIFFWWNPMTFFSLSLSFFGLVKNITQLIWECRVAIQWIHQQLFHGEKEVVVISHVKMTRVHRNTITTSGGELAIVSCHLSTSQKQEKMRCRSWSLARSWWWHEPPVLVLHPLVLLPSLI